MLTFFLSEDCPACEEVDAWYKKVSLPDNVTFVFVTRENTKALGTWLKKNPDRNVWLDSEFALAFELGVREVPSTFFVRNGSVVNAAFWPFEESFEGFTRLTKAFAGGAFDGTLTDQSKVGKPLPKISLRTPAGKPVTASEIIPSSLIIYCSAECGVCQDELADLKPAFLDAAKGAPVYLVAQPKDKQMLTKQNLGWNRLPVKLLFDDRGAFGKALGLRGTPAHIFLDRERKIRKLELGYGDDLQRRITALLSTTPQLSSSDLPKGENK